MNFVYFITFLFFVPYLQIFVVDKIFSLVGLLSVSPSLYVMSVVFFAIRMPYEVSIVFSFFLGLASSVIYGFPIGLNAFSYVLMVFLIRKVASRLDLAGFLGQLIIVFLMMVAEWLILYFSSFLWNINFCGFLICLAKAFLTALFFDLSFGLFSEKKRRLV